MIYFSLTSLSDPFSDPFLGTGSVAMIGNDEVVATFARHRGVLPSASASLAVTSDSPIDISSTMLPTYSPSTGW